MKKVLNALGMVFLLGCEGKGTVRPLNEAEQERLDNVMEAQDHGIKTVESIIRNIDLDFFNEKGETISTDEFLLLHKERREALQDYYENNRILVFTNPPTVKDVDPKQIGGAFHQDIKDANEYIELPDPEVKSDVWDEGTLMHEITHELVGQKIGWQGGHTPEMNKVAAETSSDDLVSEAREAWKQRDLMYVMNMIHSPTSDFAALDLSDVDSLNRIMSDVRDGSVTSEDALAVFDSKVSTEYSDRETWIQVNTDFFMHKNKDLMDFLGLTQDELKEALREGTIYEFQQERLDETRTELVEALTEIDQENKEAKQEQQESSHQRSRR